MLERYTDKARRVIFFARSKASEFGSQYIEAEHLLLGLLREDKVLTNRFLRSRASVESIHEQIEGNITIREKVSNQRDIGLSNESKRVLTYAAEEAERLANRHIRMEHLLVGLLREEKCLAAQILKERGLRLSRVQEELGTRPHPSGDAVTSTKYPRMEQPRTECPLCGNVWQEHTLNEIDGCMAILELQFSNALARSTMSQGEASAFRSKVSICPVCNKTSWEHTEDDVRSCAAKWRKREQGATGLEIQSQFVEAHFKNEEPDPVKRAKLHAQMQQSLCSCGKTVGDHTQDEMMACIDRDRGKTQEGNLGQSTQ